MGLSIVPAYDTESDVAANAVVVTRVLNTDGVFGYSLSVQQGNNLVTNPDPGTYSEVTIAAFVSDDEPTSLTVTRFAKPTAGVAGADRAGAAARADARARRPREARRARLLPGDARATTATAGSCHRRNDKRAALDLELKILENGRLRLQAGAGVRRSLTTAARSAHTAEASEAARSAP